jgi:hypothetical protein
MSADITCMSKMGGQPTRSAGPSSVGWRKTTKPADAPTLTAKIATSAASFQSRPFTTKGASTRPVGGVGLAAGSRLGGDTLGSVCVVCFALTGSSLEKPSRFTRSTAAFTAASFETSSSSIRPRT